LDDPVNHMRTVLMLPDDRWLVLDRLRGSLNHQYYLHWLINDFPFEQFNEENKLVLWPQSKNFLIMTGLMEGISEFSIVRASENSTRGWRSRIYGNKDAAISMALQCSQSEAIFWSYFGSDEDAVYQENDYLFVKAGTRLTRLNTEYLKIIGDWKKDFITKISG